MTIRPWHRLGRTVLIGGSVAAGLALGWAGIGGLPAQSPGPVPGTGLVTTEQSPVQEVSPSQRIYMNRPVIDLPIKMDDAQRPLIKEIHLYVKEQASAPWVLRDKGSGDQKTFRFQAPRDGEYWFAMVTVDKQGRSFPRDLQSEGPGLVIVIDTLKPTIHMKNGGDTPEGQLVQCDVQDANMDNARFRFFFQSGDKVFRPLDPVPGKAGLFCIPRQAVTTGMVRFVAQDLAGNQAVAEEHINQLQANTSLPTVAPQVSMPPRLNVEPKTPSNTPNPLPSLYPTGPDLDVGGARQPKPASLATETPSKSPLSRPDGSEGPRFSEDVPAAATTEKTLERFDANWVTKAGNLAPDPGAVTQAKGAAPLALLPPPATKENAPAKRQVVNNPRVLLDYQVDNVRTNSQSKLEIWLTRDLGKSWQKAAEDTPGTSPATVQLPGEGLFGITLLVNTGRAAPPSGMDGADQWVEVDTTKPAAHLTHMQVTHEKGQPEVHVQWTALDKNFDDGPVELFFAATQQGPWLPIAKNLPAQGQHRWTPPGEIGVQVHLRLIARDLAGNVCICNTLEPVSLDDGSRGRVTIRGVRTAPASVAPSAPPSAPLPSMLPMNPPFQIIQPAPSR